MRVLFKRIAARYDLLNRLLSLGQDRGWRQTLLTLTELPPTGKLLDVATGTGDVALLAQHRYPQAQVVGADLTSAMLRIAQTKVDADAIQWVQADGLTLAFPDNYFDAVTSSFMLRNVPDVTQALREQRRVTRFGGRVACLEMSWPQHLPWRWIFGLYFLGWSPLLGGILSGNWEAYRYLPRSVKSFMPPEAVAQQMRAVGLREVHYQLRMGGAVGIYVGVKA